MDQTRRHVRHLITPRPYVAMNGSSAGGMLYDVSPGGLSLDIVGPKPTSDSVLVDFDMSEIGEHFEAPGRIIWKTEPGPRIGIQFINLPEASHLKIRSWISAKSIAGSASPNVNVEDGTFMEYPSWLRERTPIPAISAVLEPPKNEPTPLPEHVNRSSPVAQPMPAMPKPPSNAALTPNTDDDRSPRSLRVAFSNLIPSDSALDREPVSQKAPQDWKHVGQWLLTASALLLAVLVLAAAIRISTSQKSDIGAAYQGFKSKLAMVVRTLVSSSDSSHVAPAGIPYSNPQPNKGSKTAVSKALDSPEINPGSSDESPSNDRFEVMDAQHGRRYFPRTSTNLTVQFQKSNAFEGSGTPANLKSDQGAAPGSEPASSGFITPPNTKTADRVLSGNSNPIYGRVLRESSGEIPVTETIPEYPRFALHANIQGRVVLTAIITKDGSLEDVRVLSSPSPLDGTVTEAVKTWRYQPHVENGVPVEVVTEIVVDFSITTK